MAEARATLRDELERRDAAGFVGRAAERAWAARSWREAGAPRVLLVHGAGGVGKSALLRAIGRDAADDGRFVVALDGRAVGSSLDGLERALGTAARPATVVLVDEADELAVPGRSRRDLVLGLLRDDAVIVVAGRRRPGREWFDDGAEHIVSACALDPLPDDDCRALLAHRGIDDPDVVAELVAWSGGYPLALAVASPHGPRSAPARPSDADDVGARLVEHLAGHALDDVDPLVLEVAALARAVDAQMLAAVLPGRPTRRGLRDLRAAAVTEQVGSRVALHDLVRRAVRARPGVGAERRGDLVTRIADHLATRIADEPELVIDLAELVEDRSLRAVVMGASATHVADRVRPDDLATALTTWQGTGTRWGARLARWCADAPAHVTCVRTDAGHLVGIGVAGGVDRVPEWSLDQPELGPVAGHTDIRPVAADALFLHDMHVAAAPGEPAYDEIRRVLLGAVAIRHGVTRRHMCFTSDEPMEPECAARFGFVEVPELRRCDGERTLRTWIADMGPDGVVGRLRHAITAERGLPVAPAVANTRDALALITAVKGFRDDAQLAASVLAIGTTTADRAAHVRRLVLDAIDVAFGTSERDRFLRRVLEVTYTEADGGWARAMSELHVSRATLFRHLKRARERLAATIEPTPLAVASDA